MLALASAFWAYELVGAKLDGVDLVLPADSRLWKHETDVLKSHEEAHGRDLQCLSYWPLRSS